MSRAIDTSAVVIGASGGIGSALEAALIEEGAFQAVHGFARSRRGVQHLDLLDEASIAAAAAHVGDGPAPGLVIVATGLLHSGGKDPEKALRDLDPSWLAQVYAVNAIGPALVAKHFLPIMPRNGRVVFAALSARVGSISDNRLGGWYGYRASKAALNMLTHTSASDLAKDGIYMNAVDTGWVTDEDPAQLAKYKQGKGSVQFPIEAPIPLALIARMVKFNAKSLKDNTAGKTATPKQKARKK